jgi:hypothetical protein
MLEPLFVTLLPVVLLAGLIQRALAFRRRNVDMDGVPPISKALFASSKYAIVIVWGAMVIQTWGGKFSSVDIPDRSDCGSWASRLCSLVGLASETPSGSDLQGNAPA